MAKEKGLNLTAIIVVVAIIVIVGGTLLFLHNSNQPSIQTARSQLCKQNSTYCNATVIQTNGTKITNTTSVQVNSTKPASASSTIIPSTTTTSQSSSYGCSPIPCSYVKNGNFTFVFTLNGAVDEWQFPVAVYNYYLTAPKYTPTLNLYFNNGTEIPTIDYRTMVTPGFFANVTPTLTQGKTAEQFLNEVLSIKNQLTVYSTVFENTSVYPAVILGSGKGDCKDFGVLMASIIEAGNIQSNYGMQVQFVYVDADNLSNPHTLNHLILHIDFANGTSRFIDTTDVFNTTPGGPPPNIVGWYFNLTCTINSCLAGNQTTTPYLKYTGSECVSSAGFYCVSPTLHAGIFNFVAGQATGTSWENVSIFLVTGNSIPSPVPGGLTGCVYHLNSLASGQNANISLTTPVTLSGSTESCGQAFSNLVGTSYSGALWAQYTTSGVRGIQFTELASVPTLTAT